MRTTESFSSPIAERKCARRRSGSLVRVGLTAAAGLALAACGGGDGGSSTGPEEPGDISVSAAEESTPVEGAEVLLFQDGSTPLESKITGSGGVASFRDLEPGTYTVEVDPPEVPNAQTEAQRKEASVRPGRTTDVDFAVVYTVSDVDGNVYETTPIGKLRWTAENLQVEHYRNGDPIPREQSVDAWKEARQADRGAWVYFDNDPSTHPAYGRLYNQYAVADPRGLCPVGWHVPTEADWQELELHLGMEEDSLTQVGTYRGEEEEVGGKLKSQRTEPRAHPRWNEPNNAATNQTGFTAIPNGFRVGKPLRVPQTEGEFRELGNEGPLWTSTNADNPEYPERYWTRTMQHEQIGVWRGGADGFGLGVRCVMN